MTAQNANLLSIFRLKIGLRYLHKPVWRVLLIRGHFTLEMLHYAIQATMGWRNCHLHAFRIDGKEYGAMEADAEVDEASVRIAQVLDQGSKFTYIYDFGDDWIHDIEVEGISEPEPGAVYPWCADGAGRCPPEDTGGPMGYEELLEILGDKTHPEHKSMLRLHRQIDPGEFSLAKVNRHFQPAKPKPRKKATKRK